MSYLMIIKIIEGILLALEDGTTYIVLEDGTTQIGIV